MLGTVLNDPLLPYPYDDSKENTWFDEPIIETNHGKLSLKEVKRLLAAGTSFEICISNLLQVNQIFRHQSIEFIKCCVTTLVQIGLQVRLLIEEGVNHFNSKYIVDSPDPPLVEEGQMLFPPLFFVPYENSVKLKIGNCPLNQNHPFSRWLFQNAPMVNEKYPGIFDYIRKTICSPQSREQIVKVINNTLERLRKLDEQIKPETSMNLKEEDF